MTKLEVSLPDEERQYVELRVTEGEYDSVRDYVRELIRRDRGQLSRNRVDELLLEGLDSGPAIDVTETWWQQKQEEIQCTTALPR